jgi:hypothetical protein
MFKNRSLFIPVAVMFLSLAASANGYSQTPPSSCYSYEQGYEWCSAEAIAYSAKEQAYGWDTSSNADKGDADNLQDAVEGAKKQCAEAGGTDCKIVNSNSHQAGQEYCIAIAIGANHKIYTQDQEKQFTYYAGAENSALYACRKHTTKCGILIHSCD